MKRKIISVICVISIVITAAMPVLGSGSETENIPDYKGNKATVVAYSGEDEYLAAMKPAAEDGKAILYFDPDTANIALKSKTDGAVWFSSPAAKESFAGITADTAQKLSSAVVLTYVDSTLSEFTLNSFSDAAAYGQINYETNNDGVEFIMTIGKLAESDVVPEVLTGERAEELEGKLDEKDYDYLIRSYREIKLKGDKNDKITLSDYPALADGVKVYALRTNTAESVKKKLASIFAQAGYTRDDLEEDEIKIYGKLKSEQENTAAFTLKLKYALENGDLKVTVPIDEIIYDESEYRITNISILPYFGADSFEDEGFFLLPDGSGAVSEYKTGVLGSGSPITLELYGNDSVYKYDPSLEFVSTALMPVYGQNSRGSGYIATVEKGEAQAAVYSVIDESETALRYTNFICHVRPSEKFTHSEQGNYVEYIRNSPNGYEDDFTIRYIMLENPSYSDMAVAYRNYLKENQKLVKSDVPEKGIHIELLGAVEAKKNGLLSDTGIFPLTTFEDSENIINELKGAGNLSVSLIGWANGGIDHTVFSDVSIMRELGGKKGFERLVENAKESGVTVYPEVNISHIYKDKAFDGFLAYRNASHQLDNSYARIYPYNLGSSLGDYSKICYTVKSQSVKSYNDKLLKNLSPLLDGISYEWLGSVVNTDSSKKSGSRSDSLDDYISAFEKASQTLKLEFKGGNQYVYKYASGIRELKNSSSLYRNVSFSVPFVQMVIHGSISYSSEPLNTAPDSKKAFLKAMENGEQLAYTLAYCNTDCLLNSEHTEYFSVEYSYHKDNILKNAEKADKILKDTYDKEIIQHKYITPQVVAVTYENGITVVVNYSDEDYTVNNVTVPALDAVQIRNY